MLNPLCDNELGDCMSPGLAIVSTIYEDFMRSCLNFSVNSRNRNKSFLNLIPKKNKLISHKSSLSPRIYIAVYFYYYVVISTYFLVFFLNTKCSTLPWCSWCGLLLVKWICRMISLPKWRQNSQYTKYNIAHVFWERKSLRSNNKIVRGISNAERKISAI